MAKNYVEDGKTIEIVATTPLKSGDLVQVGDMFAVAVTDVAAGSVGTGIAEGVFSVPKLATEDIASGKKVYLKDGTVQTTATGGVPFVGVAWASAVNGDESIPVKLNG
ncbi:TPA: DUF2190 family protein [Salmonella enterica subsp. enterica serovar Dublin]|nr:DUF2190 family protein [Salmonella enterica]HBM0023427.1 DUF2190 family protein [Salmonella enterica subsp. enterica serovar Muenchen]HDN6462063.1 DUF2190 family protein [Salmonella enterica subsp. enterica serovar Dublin]EEM8614174.1 DUF2190 family protein [Salmonella enterica]EEN5779563.1 DUF2190 family protein [Salmonella enterica]